MPSDFRKRGMCASADISQTVIFYEDFSTKSMHVCMCYWECMCFLYEIDYLYRDVYHSQEFHSSVPTHIHSGIYKAMITFSEVSANKVYAVWGSVYQWVKAGSWRKHRRKCTLEVFQWFSSSCEFQDHLGAGDSDSVYLCGDQKFFIFDKLPW